MDTFVINLERRPDRLKKFALSAKLAQVDFKVVDAVDGKLLSNKNYNWITKYDNLDKIRYLKKGEIGSYLSHYKCFENSTTDHVLIFEDDAKIPIDFKYQLNLLLSKVPKDFDVLLLGTTNLWNRKYKDEKKIIWKDDYFFKYDGDVYGLQSYLLSRKAINALLDCKYPIDGPNDCKFSNSGLKYYIVNKNLVNLNRMGSDSQ
tara:strand:- start:1121 stop:1729 length:609 start_codon:yes stop_codon:yes gene_type:complete